jgi:hypothetical protein
MNALGAVNRVLRANGILRGDTDAITTFSDLQHGATLQMALLAVQDELVDLVSDKLLPYEKKTSGTVSSVASTRAYSLAADFIRFYGVARLYCTADNVEIYEYPGGQDALKSSDSSYLTKTGNPFWWYFEETTSKKIGLYPTPDSDKNYTYDYEGDVSVTSSTDTLPFHNEIEAQAFCRIASRRFKMLFEGMDPAMVANDPERLQAKAVLANLIVGKNPPTSYAPTYR